MQRSYCVGIIASVFVGAVVGHCATRWLGPCRVLDRRPVAFGEDSVEAITAEVADAPSSLMLASFDRVRPALLGEARRDDAPAPALDDFARLHARTLDLECQVGQLRAELEGTDPKRQRIANLVAANEVKHANLYREVAETMLIDPESVTDDPTGAFALVVRLADETGLADAPAENHQRDLSPEPNAPEVFLSLSFGEEGATEWIRFSASLNLPHAPIDWRGSPLDLRVVLDLQRGENGQAFAIFSARGNSFDNRTGLEWSEYWSADSTLIQRSPWNGGKDDRKGGPDDFAAYRVVVDDLFEKLKLRAR